METPAKQVAIVTGGGSGIGLAIAQKFCQSGMQTIIIGRDAVKLEKAKTELGADCFTYCFDLGNLSAIPELVENIVQQFGQIDVLVNNAGIAISFVPAENMDDATWHKVIDVNLNGVFYCCRSFGKAMLEQNSLQGVGGSPEDLKAFIDGERAKWRPVIEAAKITM